MSVTYQSRAATETRNQLYVGREDIVWHNVGPDCVRIEITVANLGYERSDRAAVRLQTAPLGAFLPWRDLTELAVPSLGPSESVVLSTEVSSPPTSPLGTFDRIPPERLLTALGMFDDGEQASSQAKRPPTQRSRRAAPDRTMPPPSFSGVLSADLMALIGQPATHWAGNINVLTGKQAVERHMARALRIYPGQIALAMLVVGDSRRDAYSFELRGDGSHWDSQMSAVNFSTPGSSQTIPDIHFGHWYPTDAPLIGLLRIRPPVDCDRGEVQVCVTRQSTGEQALVEFSLDASAEGPGCFVM
jgi:hypothetical protein